MFHEWKPYVPVAERRKQAARRLAKLAKKGRPVAPVIIDGRVIAKTFWGKSWCDNLEGYGDYANRLPRGRTYVRNGSVVDLQIDQGAITAWVSGSDLYKVQINIAVLHESRWGSLVATCAGQIDSLVELLQGRFSRAVMERMCKRETGLFPAPKELRFKCSCPDWAAMCKHVAATLYGVGARLDEQPALLFALRAVDEQDLITKAGKGLRTSAKQPKREKRLDASDLSEMFGVDLAVEPPRTTPAKTTRKASARGPQKKRAAKTAGRSKQAKKKASAAR